MPRAQDTGSGQSPASWRAPGAKFAPTLGQVSIERGPFRPSQGHSSELPPGPSPTTHRKPRLRASRAGRVLIRAFLKLYNSPKPCHVGFNLPKVNLITFKFMPPTLDMAMSCMCTSTSRALRWRSPNSESTSCTRLENENSKLAICLRTHRYTNQAQLHSDSAHRRCGTIHMRHTRFEPDQLCQRFRQQTLRIEVDFISKPQAARPPRTPGPSAQAAALTCFETSEWRSGSPVYLGGTHNGGQLTCHRGIA